MINENELKNLYLTEGKSLREIASIFGVSDSSIFRYIKKYNLSKKRKYIYEDLTNVKFGTVTALSHVKTGRYQQGGTYHIWKCKCDCGNIFNTRAGNLKNLKTCKICAGGLLSKKLTKCPIDFNIWYRIKDRCRKKGIDLDITPDYLYELFVEQKGKCGLSGVDISFGKRRKDLSTASPDRINSNLGYIKGNIMWVHKHVNTMKNTKSIEELVQWCKLIVDNQTKH